MNLKSVAANLPVELLRTLVAVNKSGDLVEAAGALGTAPAEVQAQVAKLEETLGVMVFERSSAGNMRLSDHGKIVSRYAERLLSINDQLSQQLHAPTDGHEAPRRSAALGSEGKAASRSRNAAAPKLARTGYRCAATRWKSWCGMSARECFDVAVLCSMTEPVGVMITEWWEDMYWVKSPDSADFIAAGPFRS